MIKVDVRFESRAGVCIVCERADWEVAGPECGIREIALVCNA